MLEISTFLNNQANPINPAFFPIYRQLAWVSTAEKKSLGAVIALVALKHNLSFYLDSFIHRDSSSLRKRQKAIEEMLVDILFTIGSKEFGEQFNEQEQTKLWVKASTIAANFHIPVLSEKTRKRFVFGFSKFRPNKDNSFVENTYINLIDFFRENGAQIASSETPIDYVKAIANKANHNFDVAYNDYRPADEILNFINNNTLPEGIMILNLLASEEQIVFQQLSNKFGFTTEIAEISNIKKSNLVQKIQQNRDLSEAEIQSACEIFEPLHAKLKQYYDGVGGEFSIVLVPSVNLTPIPSEIILGSACRKLSIASIFHAGDSLAALELVVLSPQISKPTNLIAIGTTSEEQNIRRCCQF